MEPTPRTEIGRRRFVGLGLAAVSLPAVLAACGGADEQSSTSTSTSTTGGGTTTTSSPSLAATPSCVDADETIDETEGPYFTSGSPERTSLREDGMEGTALTITGLVKAAGCEPLANAKVDFWHADDSGGYDNEGYILRGHQFTDASGRYALETIVPGIYTGRTRHIHVKVQPEGGSVLTTQLFFPGENGNANDNIFHDELLMDVQDDGDGRAGTFDFVV